MHGRHHWMRLLGALLVATGCGSDGDDDTPDGADAADGLEVAEAEVTGDDGGPVETSDDDGGPVEVSDVRVDGSPTAIPPICEGGTGSGTRRRWNDPVSGFEYCEATCRGCVGECAAIGTADEGWYAVCEDPGTEAGCGELPGLIVRVDCG